MTIIRANEYSTDNEINLIMRDILESYLKKNNKDIDVLTIYKLAIVATTTDGEEYRMNKAEGCMAGRSYKQKNFFYMNHVVDGKLKRIKKENW